MDKHQTFTSAVLKTSITLKNTAFIHHSEGLFSFFLFFFIGLHDFSQKHHRYTLKAIDILKFLEIKKNPKNYHEGSYFILATSLWKLCFSAKHGHRWLMSRLMCPRTALDRARGVTKRVFIKSLAADVSAADVLAI